MLKDPASRANHREGTMPVSNHSERGKDDGREKISGSTVAGRTDTLSVDFWARGQELRQRIYQGEDTSRSVEPSTRSETRSSRASSRGRSPHDDVSSCHCHIVPY